MKRATLIYAVLAFSMACVAASWLHPDPHMRDIFAYSGLVSVGAAFFLIETY